MGFKGRSEIAHVTISARLEKKTLPAFKPGLLWGNLGPVYESLFMIVSIYIKQSRGNKARPRELLALEIHLRKLQKNKELHAVINVITSIYIFSLLTLPYSLMYGAVTRNF